MSLGQGDPANPVLAPPNLLDELETVNPVGFISCGATLLPYMNRKERQK